MPKEIVVLTREGVADGFTSILNTTPSEFHFSRVRTEEDAIGAVKKGAVLAIIGTFGIDWPLVREKIGPEQCMLLTSEKNAVDSITMDWKIQPSAILDSIRNKLNPPKKQADS